MPELTKSDLAEIKAFETGSACAKQAIPQLIAVTKHLPGNEVRFWDSFISGLCGAVAAQVGFENLRAILQLSQEALDKTEADFCASKANNTHH